jgi:hypothetical protein
MMHREDDVGTDDPPVFVARPLGTAADRLVEVVDERDMHVRRGRVRREGEPYREVERVPVEEGITDPHRERGSEITDLRGRLDPDVQRLPLQVVPARERAVSFREHLGDVGPLATLPQLTTHGRARLGRELASDRTAARHVRTPVGRLHGR